MKQVYINDFELYIPKTFDSASDISEKTKIPRNVVEEKLGIIQKPVEKELSTSEMSLISLRALFEKGAVDRNDVTFLISAGSDYKDRYVWTMAPKLVEELGLPSAYGFDLSSQCVGSLVALDMARSKIMASGKGTGILSVATKQNSIVNYSDPSSTFMFDFSDGSLAVALSQNVGKYEVLESSFISDGSFSDIVFSEFGERFTVNVDENSRFLRVDPGQEWKARMGSVSEKNFMKVIYESLKRSDVDVSQVGYLAFLHTKKSFYTKVLENLNLSHDRSIYLENFGHMQGVDPFLSLRLAEESGKIKHGDYIILVSSGTGWTWGATVLRRTDV